MLIRIVRLTFQEDKVDDFLSNFHQTKHLIRNFQGCRHLELLQDMHSPNVFMTYSWWDSEEDLDNYKNSELFQGVWAYTKRLFSDKPIAFSSKIIEKV